MALTLLFMTVLALGAAAAWKWGGRTERETMCLLGCVWIGTHAATLTFSPYTPFLYYFALDVFALVWLWQHQRRNWQWLPAGLFTAMLLTHLIYFSGTSSGVLIATHRPYMDILTAFAYLQIAAVGWASWERRNARHGQRSALGNWAFATDWLPRGRLDHKGHA